MTPGFNAQEILKIAIKVEENGKKFYQQMEPLAGDTKLRELWRYLGRQEDKHREIFSNMLASIGDDVVVDSADKSYQAYFDAVSQEYVFSLDLAAAMTNHPPKNEIDAINFAISTEKEAILTYTAFRDYMFTQKQAVLDSIIDEERKHLIALVTAKQERIRK